MGMRWRSPPEESLISNPFHSGDHVASLFYFTVFNISGNSYRLIALIDYQYKEVYIRHVLTHTEYDTQDWKNDPWYT